MPEKSIERNNGSYPPDPAWDHRYSSCLLPFQQDPGFIWISCILKGNVVCRTNRLISSASDINSNKYPTFLVLSTFVSYSHWEQSLAYKRRIPQADSRLNPHRAWFKLKGHWLVFSRPCVCVCNTTTSVKMLDFLTLIHPRSHACWMKKHLSQRAWYKKLSYCFLVNVWEKQWGQSHWVCGALCFVKYARTTLFNKHTIKTIIHYNPSCQAAGFINVLDILRPLSPTEQKEKEDVLGYNHEIMK